MIVAKRGMRCGGRGSVGAKRQSQGGPRSVSDHPARGRTATVPPSLKLRRTGSKEPGGAFGVDGRCVRRNRVVPTPVAGAKLSVATSIQPDPIRHQAGSDGDKTNSSPGEHGISRKAIAQGMPDCSVCTCMLVCVSLCIFAHEIAGAARTRRSLLPLSFGGKSSCKARAFLSSENAESYSVVIVRQRVGRIAAR
jgi:hypothetical protein